MNSIAYKDAVKELVRLLPEFGAAYARHLEKYGEELPDLVLSELRQVIEVAIKQNSNDPVIKRAFVAIEALAESDDPETRNLVKVSFCEGLGKLDSRLLETEIQLMGPKTHRLLLEIEDFWGGRIGVERDDSDPNNSREST
jgi:hypothetical protein